MRIERDIINKFKEWKDAAKPVAIVWFNVLLLVFGRKG